MVDYQTEHNIKDKPRGRTRRPDMASFFNQLSQIETDTPSHNNPNAQPTPVDVEAAFNLLRSQFLSLRQTSPNAANTELLDSLVEEISRMTDGIVLSLNDDANKKIAGVPQSYLDELDRVTKKELKKTDTCPICGDPFLDDEYPLVVQLPCHSTHRFDLDCVGPWLRLTGTCPLDRKELMKKKVVPKLVDDDEEDYDEMYA